MDLDNKPQPDAVLLIDSTCGGNTNLSEDGYIEGAPELIAEISASSAAIDLRDKKGAYRRNGVQEYIIWQVFERQVDWFTLQEGEYVSLVAEDRGIIRSQVFPGLWLDTRALLDGEMQQVLATLQTGLGSLEYQAFGNLLKDRSR